MTVYLRLPGISAVLLVLASLESDADEDEVTDEDDGEVVGGVGGLYGSLIGSGVLGPSLINTLEP